MPTEKSKARARLRAVWNIKVGISLVVLAVLSPLYFLFTTSIERRFFFANAAYYGSPFFLGVAVGSVVALVFWRRRLVGWIVLVVSLIGFAVMAASGGFARMASWRAESLEVFALSSVTWIVIGWALWNVVLAAGAFWLLKSVDARAPQDGAKRDSTDPRDGLR
jgi:hypothetical protein